MNRQLSIAPMMGMTDRHFRYLLRIITKKTLLYTEMVTCGALLNNQDPGRFLKFNPAEHPIALQLGGNDPQQLADCALLGEKWGYDEINLNVGCPSQKVQSGNIGACLMAHPQQVSECVKAMQDAVTIPVTVKHRTGISGKDTYADLTNFVDTLSRAGCKTFIVHARKAILGGLNPRQNRTIPPLSYETVYRLKEDFPELCIIINGGIETLAQARVQCQITDGAMIGRAAYYNPQLLNEADWYLAPSAKKAGRKKTSIEIVEAMEDYIRAETGMGTRLHDISQHMLNLFKGLPGARSYRRYLSETACQNKSGWHTVVEALRHIRLAQPY